MCGGVPAGDILPGGTVESQMRALVASTHY